MSVADGAKLRSVATFLLGSVSVAQNVYHFEHSTGSAQDDSLVSAAARNAIESYMDNLQTKIHTSVSLDEVETFERVAGEWEPIGAAISSWAGTSTGDKPPSGVALMIELVKERTGHKDRKFIAGMAEGNEDGDTWSSGALSDAAAFAADMCAEYTDANGVKLVPVYFNRSTEETKPYVDGGGSPTVSYQRRRKPGTGLT